MVGCVAAVEGDRITVATQAGIEPEDVDDQFVRRGFRCGHTHSFAPMAPTKFGAQMAGPRRRTPGTAMFRAVLRPVADFVNECVLQLDPRRRFPPRSLKRTSPPDRRGASAEAAPRCRSNRCLTDADSAVVRRDHGVHEHLEAVGTQSVLHDLGEPRVLEHAAREGDHVRARAGGQRPTPSRPSPVRTPRGSQRRSRDGRGPRRGRREEHASSGAGSRTCLPSPGSIVTQPSYRGASSRAHGSRPGFQLDCRLRLVADSLPATEHRRDCVEQSAGARRDRRCRMFGRDPARQRPRSGPHPAAATGGAASSAPLAAADHTARHPPRLADRGDATGHSHGAEMTDAARRRRSRRRAARLPTTTRRGRSRGRRRRPPAPARRGRVRPCMRRRGRDGAERRSSAASSCAAHLLDRYSGCMSWATSSGDDAVEPRQVLDCLQERTIRGEVLEIADVVAGDDPVAPGNAHRALQLGTDREHRPLGCEGKWQRLRRVATRAPQHLHPPGVERTTESSHRMWIGRSCCSKPVDEWPESQRRVGILVGDRLVADVAAGHHQRSGRALQQQMMQRAVRQHHTELGKAWGDAGGDTVAGPRAARGRWAGGSTTAPATARSSRSHSSRRSGQRLDHDREGLVVAGLAASQLGHGRGVRRVGHEVVTTRRPSCRRIRPEMIAATAASSAVVADGSPRGCRRRS